MPLADRSSGAHGGGPARHLAIVAAVAVALAAVANSGTGGHPTYGQNDRSRWCTVWSLVERGTFDIAEISQREGWQSVDVVTVHGELRSSKPAFLSVVMAGSYWLLKRITGWTLDDRPFEVVRTLVLLFNVLPFAAYLLLMNAWVSRAAETEFASAATVTVAGLGTFVTPFLSSINNHVIAAFFVFLALYAYLRGPRAPGSTSVADLGAGFCVAVAVAVELPVAAFGAVLTVAVARRGARSLIPFLLGALGPVAAFLLCQHAATGTLLPFQTGAGAEGVQTTGYFLAPSGIDSLHQNAWVYATNLTIGHHGLFSLTPVFGLSLAGVYYLLRERGQRTLGIATAVSTVVILAFYVARTSNYGGVTACFRWSIWLTPMLVMTAVPVLDRMASSTTRRGFATLLCAASIFSAMTALPNPWTHPWILRYMLHRYELSHPDLRPVSRSLAPPMQPAIHRIGGGDAAQAEQ